LAIFMPQALTQRRSTALREVVRADIKLASFAIERSSAHGSARSVR
jgi:hypothetical protein